MKKSWRKGENVNDLINEFGSNEKSDFWLCEIYQCAASSDEHHLFNLEHDVFIIDPYDFFSSAM